MNAYARITAFGLIAIGILLMIGGLIGGVVSLARGGMHLARFGGTGVGLLLGLFVFIQGAMVSATGQGLYLLAKIRRDGLPAHSV